VMILPTKYITPTKLMVVNAKYACRRVIKHESST
jgi:hypothetical protein